MLKRLSVAALVSSILASTPAAAQTSVSFALDWLPQAPQSVFMLARDKGYFAEEGLDVTIDRGFGSGDTASKVAAGTYDIGLADFSTVISFNAQNPETSLIAFYQYYDSTLMMVVGRKDRGIEGPADLEGKVIGSPEGEASRNAFPAFAAANGVDASLVTWENVTPQLRETLLAQGELDAVGGFTTTGLFNLERLGIDFDTLTIMPYAQYGVDLYGSTLVTTPAYAEANPEVLEGFVRAVIRATRDALADPAEAIQALARADDTVEVDLEIRRFEMLRDDALLTEDVRANGLGGVTPEKMALLIETSAQAYGIANPPSPEELFDDSFLPPAEERQL